jgi:hypothetical protein
MSLAQIDLPGIFRAAAELAVAVPQYCPENHPAILAAQADPLHDPGSVPIDDQVAWHRCLDRITDAANRLKRALGATGPLSVRFLNDPREPPAWQQYVERFEYTNYPRPVRQGLVRLAFAAIDLSGYAENVTTPAAWRLRGIRLLAEGLAQVWGGMSAGEREAVRPVLSALCPIIGWPSDPHREPPAITGSEDYYPSDEPRCIDEANGFYTRNAYAHLKAIQLATQYRSAMRGPQHISPARPADPATPAPTAVGEGKKGKRIDARMLKKLADDPVSANWSARQWADYLQCSPGTVKETKTWKERLKAARALEAADAATRVRTSKTRRKKRT